MFKKYENKNIAGYIIIENKSSVELHGVPPNEKKKIKTNGKGIPLDFHWRRRLKDSEIDGCVKIVAQENAINNNQSEKN